MSRKLKVNLWYSQTVWLPALVPKPRVNLTRRFRSQQPASRPSDPGEAGQRHQDQNSE